MPSRKIWKNPRTFQYDIDTGSIIQSGTIEAKSIKEARTLARQTTHKSDTHEAKTGEPDGY